jgi:hypothetical protein
MDTQLGEGDGRVRRLQTPDAGESLAVDDHDEVVPRLAGTTTVA